METKICSRCKERKDINLFYKCSATKDKHSSMCKDCARLAKAEWRKKNIERSRKINRQHYHNHKDYYNNKTKEYLKKRKSDWSDYIIKDKCEICGYNKYDILEYHHINPCSKDFNISNFIQSHKFTEKNKKILLEEIKKCMVVCPTCHREIHHLRNKNKN